MKTYTLQPRPDGKFIYIYVPELGYGTQARHAGEIERMGRDLIATVLDVEPDDFNVIVLDVADEDNPPAKFWQHVLHALKNPSDRVRNYGRPVTKVSDDEQLRAQGHQSQTKSEESLDRPVARLATPMQYRPEPEVGPKGAAGTSRPEAPIIVNGEAVSFNQIQTWADEAEAGYDVGKLRPPHQQ